VPIGGNHITKDISKVLKIDLEQAENMKVNFDKEENFFNNRNFSLELLQKIIFARIEEILKMCNQSITLSSITANRFKIVLMGEGSKILNNHYKDKISIMYDLDFLKEITEDVCKVSFISGIRLNRQEVTVVPKKLIKQGFFEKFFHLFN
jgi:cell division protein FtsA